MTPSQGDARHSPLCAACGDTGAVTAPHPQCVDADQMRLVGFGGGRSLRRVMVRCDAPFGVGNRGDPMGCPAGSERNRNLPWLSAYLAAVRVETAAVLDAMEREFYETRGVFFRSPSNTTERTCSTDT